MEFARHPRESAATRVLFAVTAITLLLALGLGGGQGSPGETLLSICGFALVVLAVVRLAPGHIDEQRLRWFWLMPVALVAVPLLQLVPLPWLVWSSLPGRAAIAADLAAAGVAESARPWSIAPLETERVLWSALVPIGIFMGASVIHGAERRILVGLALAFAGVSAFVGLGQLVEGPGSSMYLYEITNRGEAVGLFANRNHLAGFLAAALPVTAGMLVDRLKSHGHGARDLRVWALTALLILLGVTVTATHSRAGFLLLMLSVVAGAFVVVRTGRRGVQSVSRPWLRLSAMIASVLILQFTLYGILLRLDRDPLDEHRWEMTVNTLRAAAPARGTGLGLGTFRTAYDEIGDASADIPEYVNHAHDDYAELWLEGGLPALLLCVGAMVLVVAQVRRYLRIDPAAGHDRTQHRGLKLGAAFSLLLILLHSFVDYPLRTLTIASYAALLAAVLLGSVRISRGDPAR